jgi:hypothetical protein
VKYLDLGILWRSSYLRGSEATRPAMGHNGKNGPLGGAVSKIHNEKRSTRCIPSESFIITKALGILALFYRLSV